MGPWAHGAHGPIGPWAHGPMGPWAPPICLPVGDPCRGKIPGQNVYFIDFSVKLYNIV